MKCFSFSTVTPDAYRAGSEIGEALREMAPEVVLLFTSITYQEDFAGLFEGFYDGLGTTEVLVFGGTGDGVYETRGTTHHGICAMGFNSGGEVRWTAVLEPGVAEDSFGAAQRCARRAIASLARPGDPADGATPALDFAFAFADGVKSDGSLIAAGLSSVLRAPFLGGLAADDRKFHQSWVFINGEVHEGAIGILAARGPMAFVLSSASGWSPVGEPGRVTRCAGSVVQEISGRTPQAFFREQIGKIPGETDLGIVPLAAYADGQEGHYFLRTASQFDPQSGAATLFGSLAKESSVRVCTATLENVLAGVDDAMADLKKSGFEPEAALIVSCAGRRWLLEERCEEEVQRVLGAVGRKIPLIGLPSFGEIGPYRLSDGSYTPSFFHNVTFVVCLFGA